MAALASRCVGDEMAREWLAKEYTHNNIINRAESWYAQPIRALVGFQGRGAVEIIRLDFCHSIPLESLIFSMVLEIRYDFRPRVEHKTPESTKSVH
jgi:hypothetical protein